MIKTKQVKGFTLVELLVTLVVSSVVLAAVATLAFALGTANDATDELSLKQAQLRFATLGIQDLIRHSKLVCFAGNDGVALWRADENNDGRINIGELVYIECGQEGDYLKVCEFRSSNTEAINIDSIGAFADSWWASFCNDVNCIQIMPQCGGVQFDFDRLPPLSKFVSITFEMIENDITHRYQISAGLRGWAGNLLDEGDIVNDDD
ncbi:MAG: prepilin-type N-terminal cleavage/methylation domain-containing protein [Sedimentisphaerales bacterium]|nr:prepilin-type N-terminal cleavage/methylation domain-containing protein [Sedimentisphaerales bacterium]